MKLKGANRLSKVRFRINKLLLYLIFSTLISFNHKAYSELPSMGKVYPKTKIVFQGNAYPESQEIKSARTRLRKLLSDDRLKEAHEIVDSVESYLKNRIKEETIDMADGYYLIGIYYLKCKDYNLAFQNLKKAVSIFNLSGDVSNSIYSRALYNLSLGYSEIGDYEQSFRYGGASLENTKRFYGNNSVSLISGYRLLSVININIRNYEKALEWADQALRITQQYPDSVDAKDKAALYLTKGVAYTWLADYEQARSYLEKAESCYDNIINKDNDYVVVLNNLGTVYHFLGLKDKSYSYYEKGVKLLSRKFTKEGFTIINNYAIILGNDSLEHKGELLLSDYLKKVRPSQVKEPHYYYKTLSCYADYLREYRINESLAKKIYLDCFSYLNTHPWDKENRDNIILGYTLSLYQNGQNRIALDSIQTLLFPRKVLKESDYPYKNPDSLKADGRSLKILVTKYRILWSEYRKTSDIKVLQAAAQTSELIIEILEKIRLSIGEEGSRLLLGDKYRNSYMDAIMCLNECYSKTNDKQYLEKAFKYSEKSKVANLLASTREMRAMQNFIPASLADMEKDLQWNIGSFSSTLAEEENQDSPDSLKIRLLKDQIRTSVERRDSLIRVFEKNYPDYYSIKFNSNVVGMNDLPGIIGRNKNYLSYIVSDSLLYTFISNRKYNQVIIQRIDTSFNEIVAGFRKILTSPDLDEKSFSEFKMYQVYGYKLYSRLIEPVKKYLISNNLIISPDYILSYLPFETFLTGETNNNDLIYSTLPYLTNDYNISYAYSATLLAENRKVNQSMRNSAIVFSPSYNSPIDLDSIPIERQASNRILKALPAAREEAEYVSEITRGTLFTDSSATDSNYKKMAGSFDIIHLAMHTYIDIQNPIMSRLFFSGLNSNSSLNSMSAFEIYGISLKAKMVVLSSCNTGVGNLRRGEGILSLARGFIYSGSKSVVMSLWEVDDKSGTDIVKSFYRYLKNGYSKSEALRKARIDYLRNSGTVRSFPYFWSTLVIYGDDSPVYYSMMTKFLVIVILLILIPGGFIYFRKRRYSS